MILYVILDKWDRPARLQPFESQDLARAVCVELNSFHDKERSPFRVVPFTGDVHVQDAEGLHSAD